jgi:hypothetical protein
MMDDNKELDDELAALTDDLLKGSQPKTTLPEADELGNTVRQIQRTIAPDKPASPIFRDRLEMRLNLEWNRVYPRRQRFWSHRQFQYAAAASVMLVAGILALTLTKQGNDLLQAATGGQASLVIIAAIVAGVMLGAILLFLRLRR